MMKRSGLLIGLSTVFFSGIVLASSATLSDFQEAVKHDGCTSIPYEDLRKQCNDAQGDVEDYCKGGKGPYECDSLDPSGLLQKVEQVEKKIESLTADKEQLEHDKDELKDKLDNATDEDEKHELEAKIQEKEEAIAKIEKQIDELGEKRDGWKETLTKEKEEISHRIEIGQACVEHRTAVQEQFASAKDSAEDESDEDIKPLAEQLIDKWEKGKDAHEEAIENAQKAVDRCRDFESKF